MQYKYIQDTNLPHKVYNDRFEANSISKQGATVMYLTMKAMAEYKESDDSTKS